MENKLLKRFGDRLRTLRKAKSLTQEELATRAGIDTSYLNYIENGKQSPSLTKIAAIAEALEVELPEMFYFSQSKGYNKRLDALALRLTDALKAKDEKVSALVSEFIASVRKLYL